MRNAIRLRALALPFVLAGLAGCGSPPSGPGGMPTEQPVQFAYAPPLEEPVEPIVLAVEGDPALVRERILTRLNRSPFRAGPIDPAGRFAIGIYGGDPEPFVNCGYILAYRPGASVAPEPLPAAREAIRYGSAETALRRLRLDARITVTLSQEGPTTVVAPEAVYVLSRQADSIGGRSGAPATATFASGARGTFADGTVCQANGALERRAVENLLNLVAPAG